MGGGGKDGTSVLPTVNGGGSGAETDGASGIVANKRAYVQEQCLPWMYERIKLARKSRGTDIQFTEPQKIQIQEFLSTSSGAKLFAYENDDGQLRLDSNLSTQSSKEVRASHLSIRFLIFFSRMHVFCVCARSCMCLCRVRVEQAQERRGQQCSWQSIVRSSWPRMRCLHTETHAIAATWG